MRLACVCSWIGFGILFVLGKAGLLTTLQEEILTSIDDVAAKAFISFAIYQINFQSQERKAMLEMLTVEKMIGSSATVRDSSAGSNVWAGNENEVKHIFVPDKSILQMALVL